MAFLKRAFHLVVVWSTLLGGSLPAPLSGGQAPAGASREYSLKAVFLYNFCQFIHWPDSAFASRTAPLIIGVLGEDPFGPLLEEAVQGEVLHGRRLQIERYRRPEEARRCHLLFVTRSESARTAAIVGTVRGRNTVTVGESSNFIESGGMIELVTDQQRVRVRMNPESLRAANLSVSSKLLRIADIEP